MPSFSKRSLFTVFALLVFSVPLHAQTGGGATHIWFNPAGDTTTDFSGALTALTIGEDAASGADFTLELMAKVTGLSGVPGVQDMRFQIHYDSDKIVWRKAANIRPATYATPTSAAHFAGATLARYAADGLGEPLDDADPATESLLYPAWIDRGILLRAGRTVRLATLRGTWKAGASGAAALNIRAAADRLPFAAQNFRAKDLVIQGPPAQ